MYSMGVPVPSASRCARTPLPQRAIGHGAAVSVSMHYTRKGTGGLCRAIGSAACDMYCVADVPMSSARLELGVRMRTPTIWRPL